MVAPAVGDRVAIGVKRRRPVRAAWSSAERLPSLLLRPSIPISALSPGPFRQRPVTGRNALLPLAIEGMPMISSTTRRPAATSTSVREPEESGLPRLSGGRLKQPQDTELGCRAFAAADLLSAGALVAGNSRARMEHSAASWTIRADLLQRLEKGANAARRKADLAAIATGGHA